MQPEHFHTLVEVQVKRMIIRHMIYQFALGMITGLGLMYLILRW